ncbi:aldehyde dehydrogenase [Telmatospirillum sp. J64-1]|uniref:aldehyde dehydrogenase family protein n=1 Tax=Telmatospirillum sp. J64-1 TaxID=2502183 RepID=UPI00163DB789|nr:aldehyde dehydrogenase family protein [Telmatospirillum sp. J64-1]
MKIVSPIDEQVVATFPDSDASVVNAAVRNAQEAFQAHRKSSLAERAQWLTAAAAEIERDQDRLVEILIRHIGKPRRAAGFEIGRSAQFLRLTAAEMLSERGEVLPLDAVATGKERFGFTRRIPYGVVAAITPFNAPLNLLVQKVAPALAMGNAVVVKPHPQGLAMALAAAELFSKAGLPAGLFNVVPGDRIPARALVEHPLVLAVNFTGGTEAGDALARAAGVKRFLAELGSNAANVVLADADIADAAKRIASASFEASGQQCISAQRIIVEAPVYDDFLAHFIKTAQALKVGDPFDATVDVGPMVSRHAADRVLSMIEDAVERGARLVLEPRRVGCVVSPAVVADAPRDARLFREEAFGPVVVVQKVADIDEALALANASQFGLQGAVFTRSLTSAFRFSDEFDVGSLWVNEASRFRLDMYPFGGVKQSGIGREGIRYALEEMSQLKFTGIRLG